MNTIDQLRAEIRDIEVEKKNAFFENNRLQLDLYSVTQEVLHLRHALETSVAESEELKAQLKFYCIEVQRITEELRTKEIERSDLVKHLKFLGQEASALGNNRECLSEELKNCKLKLTESEKEIMRLEACIEEKECTIKSLEGKLQEIACLSNQLEEQLECIQQEKYCQGQELVSCRETLQELLMQKEALCHQLKTCECCKAKLEEELNERKCIINVLQEELAKERHHSSDLEDLLRKTKIEMNDVCLCNQRYKEEILGLSEKINFLCGKLNEEKQEHEDYQLDIETLRKQIMTARHEKSYYMKEDLKFTQRHSVGIAAGGNQVRISGLSKLKTIPTENRMKSNNRYSAMCVEPSTRRPSVSYATQYQKRGESTNKSYNDNIKEADLRYQLYLENLNKIQSYAHTYKNQKKNKNNRQCKQFNLGKNRKHLEEEFFGGGYDRNRDCNALYKHRNKNVSNENFETPPNTSQDLQRNGENNNDSRKIELKENDTDSKNLNKNSLDPVSNGVIEKNANAKNNSQTSSEFESLKSTTGENGPKESIEAESQDKDGNKLIPNIQVSQATNSSNKNNKYGTSSNENEQKSDIIPPVITTVQQALVDNTVPTKVMFQQTYSFQSRSDSIKKIDEITNDGHRKLQMKLNRLKSLGAEGDATTSTSSEMGTQDVYSINNNMYVDIANRLHEKVKKKTFCKK
ncbi:hypothetical protein WDU94_013454 [Cyamophila willieti]